MDRDRFAAHIEASRDHYYDELCALLRQPSIAAQGLGLEETAAIVVQRLERLGAAVSVLRLPGAAPVVYGSIGSGARTLLIYDHYDVQPPEPLERWVSPAFDPTPRDGKLYARGVADRGRAADKNQLSDRGRGGNRLGSPGAVLPSVRRPAARRWLFVGNRWA